MLWVSDGRLESLTSEVSQLSPATDVHLDRLRPPEIVCPIEANSGDLDRMGVAEQHPLF